MPERTPRRPDRWRQFVSLTAGLGVLAALVQQAGCEVAVGSELGAVHCTQEGRVGPPDCPAGQACYQGECVACADHEECGDGLDNDCNGAVDDGCGAGGKGGKGGGEAGGGSGAGAGGSGATGGAGGKAGAGGSMPAGSSGSSGAGGASAGASGSAGSAGSMPAGSGGSGGVVAGGSSGASGSGGASGGSGGASGTGGSGGSGGTAGGSGMAGAAGSGGGPPPPPAALGESCAATTCDGNSFCLSYTDLGKSGPDKICVTGCCSSDQCPEAPLRFVCVPSKLGGVCVPAGATFGRASFVPDASNPNDFGEVGKACTQNQDCRSGWCDNKQCNDLCCSNDSCKGRVCSRSKAPVGGSSLDSWACVDKPSGGDYGAICADVTKFEKPDDTRCSSRLCSLPGADLAGIHDSYCAKPCCSSAECAGGISGRDVSCTYVGVGSSQLRACTESALMPFGISRASLGEGCGVDDDCLSGVCLASKVCSDACCSDSDCASASMVCRPTGDGGTYGLHCVKP